jgi:hypothetical protein
LFFPFSSLPLAPRRHILALDDQLSPSLRWTYPGLRLDGRHQKRDFGHFSERRRRPMPTIHSSQNLKLLHGSIDNQQLLHRTRPIICINSAPIDGNLIHRQSSPETRPLQITSFVVPMSPFRRQVQAISQSLRHARDVKSVVSLTRKTHWKLWAAKPSSTCLNETVSSPSLNN